MMSRPRSRMRSLSRKRKVNYKGARLDIDRSESGIMLYIRMQFLISSLRFSILDYVHSREAFSHRPIGRSLWSLLAQFHSCLYQ